MSLTVESTRFGTLEIKPEAVLSFPRGLIGLGGSRYALLSTDPDSPFSWLHSVEDPDLALPVVVLLVSGGHTLLISMGL